MMKNTEKHVFTVLEAIIQHVMWEHNMDTAPRSGFQKAYDFSHLYNTFF